MPETVSHVGEFGTIHRIDVLLEKEGIHAPGVNIGIGDDTASFKPPSGYEMLVTCDCMVEGRHYLPEHITPMDLGRRAMVSNISDIGAMGGTPLYALVSLGLKPDTLVTDVEELYRGFLAELNPMGASIIGGNLTKAQDAAFIDITLMGKVEEGKGVRRSTAKPGDVILVTGYPGQAAAGLQLLIQGEHSEDLREHPLVKAYHTPLHRAREGKAIAETGWVTAMIDVSDGFLGDLGHICDESGVGASVIQEKLPVSEELRQAAHHLELGPYDFVLQDSDDYELIFTCPPGQMELLRSSVGAVSNVVVTEVGKITDAHTGIKIVSPDGTEHKIATAGWDHFSRREDNHV